MLMKKKGMPNPPIVIRQRSETRFIGIRCAALAAARASYGYRSIDRERAGNRSVRLAIRAEKRPAAAVGSWRGSASTVRTTAGNLIDIADTLS